MLLLSATRRQLLATRDELLYYRRRARAMTSRTARPAILPSCAMIDAARPLAFLDDYIAWHAADFGSLGAAVIKRHIVDGLAIYNRATRK